MIEVVCAVFIRHRTVLAARRLDNGLWEFPGGKVEERETREEALRREIWEEMNVEPEILRPLPPPPPFERLQLVPFLCEPPSRIPHLAAHSECRWIDLDEAVSLRWCPADLPVLNEVRRLMEA